MHASLDKADRIDITNTRQMQLLFRYYSHNAAAVQFWLHFCVFPEDTQQYPYRLVATSWNLVDTSTGRVVGFSGTNDNHRLLPPQVSQLEPDEHELRATNGMMLARLLEVEGYTTLAFEVRHRACGGCMTGACSRARCLTCWIHKGRVQLW